MRPQLSPQLVNSADRVVVIAARRESPGYLVESAKAMFWDVEDPDGSRESLVQVFDEIRNLVNQLSEEIG